MDRPAREEMVIAPELSRRATSGQAVVELEEQVERAP
jgi:hypothetical protein